MDWKNISTAPKNTVVITEIGFGIEKSFTNYRTKEITSYWSLCDCNRYVPCCADDGDSISQIFPKKWISLEEIGL